jgi:hypothetical protein
MTVAIRGRVTFNAAIAPDITSVASAVPVRVARTLPTAIGRCVTLLVAEIP